MTIPVALTEEEWRERFKPVQNQFDPNASYDGCLFETYGDEHAQVSRTFDENPNRIWTLIVEGDDWDIVSGYHFVNRMGYFICDIPFDDGAEFIVADRIEDGEADPCRTDECDGDPDDGDGWDGFCGNCADRRQGAEGDDTDAEEKDG